jgi:hypothetical protein
MSPRDVAGHFLIAIAGVVLLGGTAHFFGFSGRVVFVVVVAAIFIASVLIPEKKRIRNEDGTESSDKPKS